MCATKSLGRILIFWVFCSLLVASAGQTASTKQPTSQKAPSTADEIEALTKLVQDYQTQLRKPDIANSPKTSSAIKADLIRATCQIEVLSLPTSIQQKAEFVDEVSAACLKRLNGQQTVVALAPVDNGASHPTPAAAPDPAPATADSAPTPCPTTTNDGSIPTIILDSIDTNPAKITGTITPPKGGKSQTGSVQLCADGNKLGPAASFDPAKPASAKDTFSVSLQQNSSNGPTQLVATDGKAITAQFSSDGKTWGPPSPPQVVASCKETAGSGTAPSLKPLTTDSTGKVTTVSGTVEKASSGNVRICADDRQLGTAPIGADGTFSTSSLTVKPGNTITAEVVTTNSGTNSYSKLSNEVRFGACSSVQKGDTKNQPTLNPISVDSTSFSGTLPNAKGGEVVRICVDDQENTIAIVDSSGSFIAAIPQPPLQATSKATAQVITDSTPTSPAATFGLLSVDQPVGGKLYSKMFGSFIAGFIQSGYSAEVTNTNFFLSAYLRSQYWGFNSKNSNSAVGGALWGRIRLLSAPAPSTVNLVSVITDPSGTLTQSSFSSVGQVVDYVFGPELRLFQTDFPNKQAARASIFADIGATTPLASNSVTLTYNAPAPNTTECAELIRRYPPNAKQGTIGLYPGPADPTTGLQSTCVINPVTKLPYSYVAFTNQDRSNFLGKYGAGFRFTHVFPAKSQGGYPYAGYLDAGFGQDETITGGRWHGAVFKLEGQYPFAYGPMSFIYFFGSASLRLSGNQNYPALILTSPSGSNTPIVPSANVTVLSLQQPNRDFYTIGVGLNLLDIFTKLKNGPSTGTPAPAPAPAAATKP
jgi:hypothetical protein